MQSITVQVQISMGHRLPSYNGICASPHGHNVRIEVELETASFVDFKLVQEQLKRVTDQMDHAMVLFVHDPLLPILRDRFKFRTYVLEVEPTTENIAWEIFRRMSAQYSETIRCTVHETDKYSATVRSTS